MAIIGNTNVGKSSLINQIVKKDIAIVSKTSGTTRDIIETKIDLSNIPIILSDTAGLKKVAKSSIERIGIRKSKKKIKDCHIKLLVVDSTKKIDKKILNLSCNKTKIILNKIDL